MHKSGRAITRSITCTCRVPIFGRRMVGGLLAAGLIAAAGSAQAGINSAMVPVRDAGNLPDSTGYGAVSYNYNIGQYDVTLGQYTAFLNAVATKSDPYGLYTSYMASGSRNVGH